VPVVNVYLPKDRVSNNSTPVTPLGHVTNMLCNTFGCVLCAPAVNVYLPKDRVTNNHQGYGFVEYRAEEDADYVSLHAWGCCRVGLELLQGWG
jgi:RNA recognition motif-containing protein